MAAPWHLSTQCRPYLVNLLPCLAALARRPEESVHEALATNLPLLLATLGSFTNDNEVKILIQAFLANVGSSSTAVRRSTASCLACLVTSCRKPNLFSSWLLTTAVGLLLPLNAHTLVTLISGVLSLCRSILPTFATADDEAEALLQLYELCIHFLGHKDHNIVNASLETLQQLLRSAPSLLTFLLATPGAAGGSRLATDQHQEEVQGEEQGQATDLPSLQSMSDMTEVMTNTILSFPEEGEVVEEVKAEVQGEEEPPPDPGKAPTPDPGEVGVEAVGRFEDGGVSLHFLGRRLVAGFLLTREKGEMVADSRARVSVKTLALSCLGEVVMLSPQLWSLPVFLDQVEALTSPVVSDLTVYLEHEDPGLRGAAGRLVARVVRGAALESGGRLDSWFLAEGQPGPGELVEHLAALLADESSVAVRQGVAGARLLLPRLLQASDPRAAASLLARLPPLAANKYWLVRLDLCELLAAVPALPATYLLPSWSEEVLAALTSLLGDEDARVRSAAARALVTLTPSLPLHNSTLLPNFQSELLAQSLLHSTPPTGTPGELPSPLPSSPSALFPLLSRISSLLCTSSSRHLSSGCIEVLALLAAAHPPLLHPTAWGVHATGRTRRHSSQGPAPLASPALSLLSFSTQLLTAAPACQALATHGHLLHLTELLYSGLAGHHLRSTTEAEREGTGLVVGDQLLSDTADTILLHLLRLLAILHHVFEDTVPTPPSSKPTLPSLPNTSLSPIKKRSADSSSASSPTQDKEKPFSPKDEKKFRGSFSSSPYYMKQFEVLRASHAMYKTSLEPAVEERLATFTNSVLDCLSTLLEFSNGVDIGKYVEEILSYVKSCLTISASSTLRTVQCLLKCLFKSNFTFMPYSPSPTGIPTLTSTSSIFDNLISRPYTMLTIEHGLVVEGMADSTTSTSSPVRRGE